MAPRQKLDVSTQNAANRRLGTGLDSKIRRRSTEAIQTMERMGFDPMVAAIHTFRKIDQEIYELQALKSPDEQVLNKDGSMRRFSMRALTELYGHQIKICSELLKYRYAKVPEITGDDQKDLPAMTVRLSGGVRAGVHRINGGSNASTPLGAQGFQDADQYQAVSGAGTQVPGSGRDLAGASLDSGHANHSILSDDEIRARVADRLVSEGVRNLAQDRLRELEQKLAAELPSDSLDDPSVIDVRSVDPGLPARSSDEDEEFEVIGVTASDLAEHAQSRPGRTQGETGADRHRSGSDQESAWPGRPVPGHGEHSPAQDQAGASPSRQGINPGKLKVPSFGYPHSTGPSILKPPVPLD